MLRGNPGRRPLNEDEPKPPPIEPDSSVARCPNWMKGDARELWKRVAPGAMRTGLLTIVDLPNFEAYCVAYSRWREFERLTGKNLELAISKGYRNGAVKERQLMLQLSARFGFDPSSRSNVTTRGSMLGAAGKPESRTEQFRRAKAQ